MLVISAVRALLDLCLSANWPVSTLQLTCPRDIWSILSLEVQG